MIITDLSEHNFEQTKRLFVFGCSFTQYRWPTWADIIARNYPHLEYHNSACSGAGNLYIFSQLNQYINHFKPGPDDLVMILWSSFYREDRYITHGWKTPGNIYTQGDYDEDFVTQYCCPRGMTIRDLALIDTATKMLETAEFPAVQSLSVPYELQDFYSGKPLEEDDLHMHEVYDLYAHLSDSMSTDLMSRFPNGWKMEYEYAQGDGEMYQDYHPSVQSYAEYVQAMGVTLSKHTLAWVMGEHQRMLAATHIDQLIQPQPKWIV